MQKIFVFIIICFLCIGSLDTYAKEINMDITYDGVTMNYTAEEIFIEYNNNPIITAEMPPIVLNDRTLVPAREVFEQMGAKVEWNQKVRTVEITNGEFKVVVAINNKVAYTLKNDNFETLKYYDLDVPAKIINNKTMIPIRFVGEALSADVKWDGENRKIIITKEVINDDKDNEDKLNTNENKVVDFLKENLNIVSSEDNEYDLSNNVTKKNYSDASIVGITSKYENEKTTFEISANSKISSIDTQVFEGKVVIDINNATTELTAAEITHNIEKYKGLVRVSQFKKDPNIVRVVFEIGMEDYKLDLSDDRKTIKITFMKNKLMNINLDKDNLEIETSFKTHANIFRMVNPDRIVIDMNNTESKLGSREYEIINSDKYKTLRTSQFNEDTVRIVLELKNQFNYEIIDDNSKKIVMNIKDSGFENINYENFEDFKLTLKDMNYNYVSVTEDYLTSEYVVTLKNNTTFKEGKLNVNDKYVDYFEVEEDDGDTIIRIKSKNIIALNTKDIGEDVLVEIIRPGEKYDKVLVIDPGHGGSDPGAVVDSNTEKALNLDISMKIKKYLEENSDIKVYMTREEDNYPSLTSRPEMANDIKADMFISIHNNAFNNNTSIKGTEVLYKNSSNAGFKLSNKEISEIILDDLVDATGNYRRGVWERGELIVLKYAKVPAALVEVAFMTNKEDLKNLNDDEYIEKVVNSIGNSIIKIYKKV